MKIDHLSNKALKQVDFKTYFSINGSGSGGGSYSRSEVICHNCGKNGYFQKYCRSEVNFYSGKLSKNSTNEIPEWVTNKPVVLNTNDIAIYTTTHNNNNDKCCNYCNNGNS